MHEGEKQEEKEEDYEATMQGRPEAFSRVNVFSENPTEHLTLNENLANQPKSG